MKTYTEYFASTEYFTSFSAFSDRLKILANDGCAIVYIWTDNNYNHIITFHRNKYI